MMEADNASDQSHWMQRIVAAQGRFVNRVDNALPDPNIALVGV
jgi:hypothetical protein